MLDSSVSPVLRGMADMLSNHAYRPKIAFTALGSELPYEQLLMGAVQATEKVIPVIIGPEGLKGYPHYEADTLPEAHRIMEELLASGEVAGAVTLHYTFPLGVSTVTRIHSVATGRSMILSSTTGCMDSHRNIAMVKNTIAGMAVADSLGVENPRVGILNVDGAVAVVQALKKLVAAGFPLCFADSVRDEGGKLMRGNDLIRSTPDVMVCDSLTGNLLVKILSAGFSGGEVEVLGCGYGIALGPAQKHLVGIISRASGPSVIQNALHFCALMAQKRLLTHWHKRWQQACRFDHEHILSHASLNAEPVSAGTVNSPPETVLDDDISGIDVLSLEEAQLCLWSKGIYARTGMGCTGPVLMINHSQRDEAMAQLHEFLK